MRERERERDNQPQIRFQAFKDEWKLKKLEEISTYMPGKSYEKFMKSEGLYELTKMITVGFDGNFVHSKLYVDQADWLLQKNDLVMMINEQGVGEHLGRVVLVPENNTYVLNGTVGALRPNQDIDPFFLKYNINNNQYYFKNNRLGTSILYVRRNTIEKMSSCIPNFEEQRELGNFFRIYEIVFENLQSKINNLEFLKHSLLSTFFVNTYKTEPHIRFKNFYDKWNIKCLGDISEKVKEKNKELKYTETFSCSGKFGLVTQSDVFSKSITNIDNINTYYVVREDDFVFNPSISDTFPAGPLMRNNLKRVGVSSPMYYIFRLKSENHDFIEYFFLGKNWTEYVLKTGFRGVRAKVVSIADEDMKKLPITMPSLSEQTKIGKLFKTLDKLINLQSKEIHILKELKKTAMKMMLV
ncbi:restriction endonuclease subunit S [Mycoplasma sp. Ms02]|uniref:restriction endonuclease subunit S n=1 Tax=Mycoplasma sp. Ms02 TaxID=353851 RepID=UPI001C89E398|nr:restriction endonuclease subunit S [Mycoplasma sp. Ms02]QZE12503.1 restriction endonuclease subunit S [Mycoplasma sp. Ms02]